MVGGPGVSPRKIFQISCVAIAIEKLLSRRHRKNCDASIINLASVVNASSRRCRGLGWTVTFQMCLSDSN